jgi:hypothetical protein
MKYKCYFEAQVWILRRRIVVLPPLYFYFPFLCGLNGSLFYISHLSSLGSFHLCPLWDLLICPLWDLFLTVRATLYIKMNMINTLLQGTHNETGTIS